MRQRSAPGPVHPTIRIGCGHRSRADRAQLSAQDVDELRQLVEPRGAQQPADTGDPPVPHRSELEDLERPPPSPQPNLSKEHRPSVVEQDRRGDAEHHGAKNSSPPTAPHTSKARCPAGITLYITK